MSREPTPSFSVEGAALNAAFSGADAIYGDGGVVVGERGGGGGGEVHSIVRDLNLDG